MYTLCTKINEGYLFRGRKATDGAYGILDHFEVFNRPNKVEIQLGFGINQRGTLTKGMKYTANGFVPLIDNTPNIEALRKYLERQGSYSVFGISSYICTVKVEYTEQGIEFKNFNMYVPVTPMYYRNKLHILSYLVGVDVPLADTLIQAYKNEVQNQLLQMNIQTKEDFIVKRTGA